MRTAAITLLSAIFCNGGNLITNERRAGSTPLQMSNGLTSIILDVLVIAGSDLATEWEKKIVYWLALHDQSLNGIGCVGFDIEEMGWERDDFDTQKRFILAIIDSALGRHG